MKQKKHITLPVKYEAGFLKDFDRRTEIYERLNTSYQTVLSDLGGVENLSHAQICLVERFVFLEFTLREWEKEIALNPKKSEKLVSRWIQAINSLTGIGKTIGLERRARGVINLKNYIAGQ